MNPEQIVHPLARIKTIQTDQGIINFWGFASIVWAADLEENSNAMSIIQELFPDQTQIISLLCRSQQRDETAVRQAISLLAFGLEEKATEAFGEL